MCSVSFDATLRRRFNTKSAAAVVIATTSPIPSTIATITPAARPPLCLDPAP